MSFRDSLKALIVPEKLADAEKVFDKLDEQLNGYDTDIKALKKSLREKEGVKPEDLAALEAENAELRKSNAEQTRLLKKAEADAKAASDSSTTSRDRLHKLMRDDGLRKELVGLNIRKELLDAAHALLREGVQIDDEKGEAYATVKDKDGKETRVSLTDYVKGWAATDSGKAFIPAGDNSGGGAGGQRSAGGSGKTMGRAQFEALDPAAKLEFSKAGGTLTE